MLQARLGYKLRRAQMVYFDVFFEACAQEGITPGLFSILAIIYHNPGFTQSAVSAALDVDRSAMVAANDKLESMEVVERRKSKNDRPGQAWSYPLSPPLPI
jgi:DNA-binding MarR family transcriptional regulator